MQNLFFLVGNYFRESEINKVPKFCEVIFSLNKAKNADDAFASASIYNDVKRKKNKYNG